MDDLHRIIEREIYECERIVLKYMPYVSSGFPSVLFCELTFFREMAELGYWYDMQEMLVRKQDKKYWMWRKG